MEDQRWFAEVTGDRNPIHIDETWAQTHFPGEIVVHGMHLVLAAIDRLEHRGGSIDRVSATFVKPVVTGDSLRVAASDDLATIRIFHDDALMALVRLTWGAGRSDGKPATGWPAVDLADLRGADFAAMSGVLPDCLDGSALVERYPRATHALGAGLISGLARLSTLVGMACPGLSSLFSEFAVERRDDAADSPLAWRVSSYNSLFSRVEMAVEGMSLSGRVVAFAGRDVAATDSQSIAPLVTADRYAGSHPLVVGGSGGLGAATAQILAAGGATPIITFARNEEGARSIARSIASAGGHAEIAHFDTGQMDSGFRALAVAGWDGDEAYFFATPRIFRRNLGCFDPVALSLFVDAYVDRFARFVELLRQYRDASSLTVFYPSTVAVIEEVADLYEYAVAKAAGERLCTSLERRHKGLRIVVGRLPRTQTRQTQSFVSIPAKLPHEVMLEWVEAVQSGHAC